MASGEERRGDLEALARRWWSTVVVGDTGPEAWDDEIRAVNALAAELGDLPEWAINVRDAMPRYGFEMCSHRWLDGLDLAIAAIAREAPCESSAGRCGDVPGRVFEAVGRRVVAVERWLDGAPSGKSRLGDTVARWLGEPTTGKREAAECFVELAGGSMFRAASGVQAEGDWRAAVQRWRERAGQVQALESLFSGQDRIDGVLEALCGYRLVDRLDQFIRGIGGDRAALDNVGYGCNAQLRTVFGDDPDRYEVTRGYLWGVFAYLAARDVAWLQETRPECWGAAAYAAGRLSRGGATTAVKRWLCVSLLKATKLWCEFVLIRPAEGSAPDWAWELPSVEVALA